MDIIKIFVPKKDHNIILKHQLSWYFIPLLLIIWFLFPESHFIFSTSMICIVIIGIIETIFFTPLTIITKFYSVISHLLLLVPIFYNKIFKNLNKNPKKSCLLKNNSERKGKNVKFSNNNKNFYRNDIRYLVRFNVWNLLLLVVGILIIIFLPYWPYFMSRKLMMIILIIVTIILWIYAEYF